MLHWARTALAQAHPIEQLPSCKLHPHAWARDEGTQRSERCRDVRHRSPARAPRSPPRRAARCGARRDDIVRRGDGLERAVHERLVQIQHKGFAPAVARPQRPDHRVAAEARRRRRLRRPDDDGLRLPPARVLARVRPEAAEQRAQPRGPARRRRRRVARIAAAAGGRGGLRAADLRLSAHAVTALLQARSVGDDPMQSPLPHSLGVAQRSLLAGTCRPAQQRPGRPARRFGVPQQLWRNHAHRV